MDSVAAFILAGFALAGSPGPNTLSLAAAGAAFGPRRSLGYMIGLLVGMIGVMAVTAAGLVGLVLALPGATPAVSVLAAAYFLYLSYRIATAPPLAEDAGGGREPSFLAGVLLSLVNPKGYAAMAALFSGFVLIAGHPSFDAAIKGLVLTAILAAVNGAWLMAGSALTRHFRDPRANRIINAAFAALLILSLASLWL